MCTALAKRTPPEVVETSGEEIAGVMQATDVARIRAFRDFLSEDEAEDGVRRQENSGTDEIARRNSHRDSRNNVLVSVFRLSRFPTDVRGPCVGDHLCGNRLTSSHPMPIRSNAQIQVLAYVECVGCLGNEFRTEATFLELPDWCRGIASTTDVQLVHLVLKCCSFQPEARCGSTLAGYSPGGGSQSLDDDLPLSFFES
jgi:hypothetical protein